MGSTFSLTLLKKSGPMSVMKKDLVRAFESMGYIKTSRSDPAGHAFSVYAPRKGSWNALVLPGPLTADDDFLRQLSTHLNEPILSFFNFDSDLLSLCLTDGEQTHAIHCGAAAGSLSDTPLTEEASAFFHRILLPDKPSFTAFLEIIRQKPDFSEEIADRLAPLLNYPEALVYTDELHDPSAVLFFRYPGEQLPSLLPEADPPAFHTYTMHTSHANPTHLSVRPCGGKGRGVRLMLVAEDYDAEDWHVPVVALRKGPFDWCAHSPDEFIRAVPVRCTFASGRKGWRADFPDVEITQGLTRPACETALEREYIEKHCFTVHIPFCGGKFHHEYRSASCPPDALGGRTRLILSPMENPEGFASATVPRFPFEENQANETWLGSLADEYK